MSKTQPTNMSYIIHTFMCEELGLGGGELLVFAIIYSFTYGSGFYYGGHNYIAKSSGLSISTVKRAISSLLKKKFITRHSESRNQGYKTTEIAKPRVASDADKPCTEAKEKPTAPLKIEKRAEFDISDCISQNPPKYEYRTIGRNEIVHMTPEQYTKLLTLVEPEVLFAYVRKLEILIKEQNYRTFSPYKTIKEWIHKDAAV